MFWETLWALVLGFAVSGAVQAFVTREQMERVLGHPGPRSLARATFLGMVSSSCSYAAAAMAKSLFAKGADLTAALVFMIASTNLVVELGIVLAVLIGWQFTASEFVGGLLMITLFGLLSRFLLPRSAVDAARRRLSVTTDDTHENEEAHLKGSADPRPGIGSLAGWADAAGYAIADVTMLRRELLIGFTVAGMLAVLVPDSLWGNIFVSGHGFASSLENVLVGPLIAILSFVCSIGNIPLAAALWKGGISFGGVVAFVFADLITLPLLFIYRRYYGAELTLRMLAGFWLVMSASGLAIEYVFAALHAIPSTRPTQIAAESISVNYTTVLNIVALVVVIVLYSLHRKRGEFAAGVHVRDPICGMLVEAANAPAQRTRGGVRLHFCSDGCAKRFDQQEAAESGVAASEPRQGG